MSFHTSIHIGTIMDKGFKQIIEQYTQSHQTYGDTPHAIMTPKGRNDLRYSPITSFINHGTQSLLDYGCGIGLLYNYIKLNGWSIDYTGYDITPSFIKSCEFNCPDGDFKLIEPDQEIHQMFDIVFASGVFNLKSSNSDINSKEYTFDRIAKLFEATNNVLICDFLSDNVDYRQDGAQHFSASDIASFCQQRLTRKFMIRHDILPYEFTLIAFKDDSILRPSNIYKG